MTAEAVAAVYRPVATWTEGDGGICATLGTHHGIHLPGTAVTVAPLASPRFSTCGTALGLIRIALRCEELLLTNGEREVRTTIETG